MTRGELSESSLKDIDGKLTPVIELHQKSIAMSPAMVSAACGPGSDVPVAAVCLQDCTSALCDCRLALHECYAHGIYYREHCDPPREHEAVTLEAFFLDDLAVRLYSSAEHLANALVFMLELTEADLRPYAKAKSSRQIAVGKYLASKLPDHLLTKPVARLASSDSWRRMIDYRSRWVHDQPPLLGGMGFVYRRRSRWEVNPGTGRQVLRMSESDDPELTVAEVRAFLEESFNELAAATTASLDHFIKMLEEKNLRVEVVDGRFRVSWGM